MNHINKIAQLDVLHTPPSAASIETNVTPYEHLKEVYDYLPYDHEDIDYLYTRNFDDILTDQVQWIFFPKELLTIMKEKGRNFIKLAKKMKHSLRKQWTYFNFENEHKRHNKRHIVYIKFVYKYIYDHQMCLDNFF